MAASDIKPDADIEKCSSREDASDIVFVPYDIDPEAEAKFVC